MRKIPDRSPSSRGEDVAPGRVVVLVDASPDALRALEVAADLARRHDSPLLAVSVEEPDRTRSSAYSFAAEVCAASGAIRAFDADRLTRRLERGPDGIRRVIERIIGADDLACEVAIVRGRLVEEVLALSRPGDFLMLGRVGWSSRLGRRLGRTPLLLARRADGVVQICSAAPARERGRIAMLVEDADSARTMLALAAERAMATGRALVVLQAPTAAGDANADRLARMIGPAARGWRFRALSTLTTGELAWALAGERAVELLVQRRGEWLASEGARRLLERLPLTVLVTA